MSQRALIWTLLGLSPLGVGCAGGEQPPADQSPAVAETPKQTTPEPPPLPKPLMRQAMHCCKNLTMEPVVRAYLDLGVALADKDAAAIGTQRAALTDALSASNLAQADKDALGAAIAGVDDAELVAARKAYAETSELLVQTVQAGQAGALDLAVAYSRQADAHWLQEGVEPKSPYGDGINSYSWGTRDEVKTADAAREKELGNRP